MALKSFNRTFLVLKCGRDDSAVKKHGGFNRTFLVLKAAAVRPACWPAVPVLIAPFWY